MFLGECVYVCYYGFWENWECFVCAGDIYAGGVCLVVRCSLVIAFVLRAAQSLRVFGALAKFSPLRKNRLNFRPGPAQLSTPECERQSFIRLFSPCAFCVWLDADLQTVILMKVWWARVCILHSAARIWARQRAESTFVKSLVGVGDFPLSAIFSCGIIKKLF